jgi:arabinogalactan oligomer/maltooligosaccharide transport system permease protein
MPKFIGDGINKEVEIGAYVQTNPGDIFTNSDNSLLMLLFGVVTIGVIGLYLINHLSNIKSSYFLDEIIAKGKKPNTFIQDLKLLLDERFHIFLLTPSLIAAIIFTVLPTLFMILIAFTNFDVNHQPPGQLFTWVGFQNFIDIFDGSSEIGVRFIPVLSWTLIWAVIATFSNYFAGILLAMLINQKKVKFKTFWRTIFVLTIATPQFISLLAVRNLLSLDGPINQMLLSLGLLSEKMEFLTGSAVDPNVARASILFINLWVGIPYTMLMTSGILMNIPKDLYEAATVDGANRATIFFKITLPYIIFVTTPYLITSFIGNITSFNIIYLLTGGGPAVPGGYIAGQTDLLVTWLYKLTVEQNNYNLGSVIGIITFILTATGTLITYRRSKTYKEEEAFQA